MLSHMVVKRYEDALAPIMSLRVVLSHMVVKLALLAHGIDGSLRVVLSHMVVKPGRPSS